MWKLYSRSQAGISLIEVMVVVAIAGILLALAVPSFVSMTQRFRTAAAASAFVGDLRFARSEALKRGLSVTVCASADGAAACAVSAEWNIGWLILPTPSANGSAPAPLRRHLAWTSGDRLGADAGTAAIRFNRDGFIDAMPASGVTTLILRTDPANDTAMQCITLTRTGRARTRPAQAGACP